MTKKWKFRFNTNGYILVRYKPYHPRKFTVGGHKGFVYEHILVAEKNLGRRLKANEQVHHLDLNKGNNSPNNLIVLPERAHQQIHKWIRRGAPLLGAKKSLKITVRKNLILDRSLRKDLTTRCKTCGIPISINKRRKNKFLCISCREINRKQKTGIIKHSLTKEKLEKEISKSSWVNLGKKYGVSDNAVRQWARKLGIDPKTRRKIS